MLYVRNVARFKSRPIVDCSKCLSLQYRPMSVFIVHDNGDGEADGRYNGMSDLYRSVHGP